MRTNLPREMDFVVEAQNAARTVKDFANIRTSLYIPQVIHASKRVLIMEYIQGGRVDDLPYLAKYGIDRNRVSIELSRIFNRMVFINGWFHAVSAYASFSPNAYSTESPRTLTQVSFLLAYHPRIVPTDTISRKPFD